MMETTTAIFLFIFIPIMMLIVCELLWRYLIKPMLDQIYVNEHRGEPGIELLADSLGVARPSPSPQQILSYYIEIEHLHTHLINVEYSFANREGQQAQNIMENPQQTTNNP